MVTTLPPAGLSVRYDGEYSAGSRAQNRILLVSRSTVVLSWLRSSLIPRPHKHLGMRLGWDCAMMSYAYVSTCVLPSHTVTHSFIHLNSCLFSSPFLSPSLPSSLPLHRVCSSPHLLEVRERIRINGRPLSKAQFSSYFWHCHNKLTSTKVQHLHLAAITVLKTRVMRSCPTFSL